MEAGTDDDLGHLPCDPSSNGTKLFLLQHQAARPVWSKTHGYLGVTLCCIQHQSQGLQQQLLQLLPVLEAVFCRGIEQMWVCLAPRRGYSRLHLAAGWARESPARVHREAGVSHSGEVRYARSLPLHTRVGFTAPSSSLL